MPMEVIEVCDAMFDKINNVRNWQLLHCVVSSEWKFTEDFLKKEVEKKISSRFILLTVLSLYRKCPFSQRRHTTAEGEGAVVFS